MWLVFLYLCKGDKGRKLIAASQWFYVVVYSIRQEKKRIAAQYIGCLETLSVEMDFCLTAIRESSTVWGQTAA